MDTKSMRGAIPAAKAVGTDERIVGMVEGSADEIDRLRTALAQAERQRDEARGSFREIDKRHLTRDMAEKVDAHLRDTGE